MITFLDDGPSVSASLDPSTSVTLDETNLAAGASTIDIFTLSAGTIFQGADPDVAGSPTVITGSSTGNVLSVSSDLGVDGSVDGLEYSLAVTNTNSGLFTTDGTLIQLFAINDTVVVGLISGTTTAAFAFEIDPATGEVTVEQYMSLLHLDAADPDDPTQLAAGSLAVRVSGEDGDGDDASASVDISGNFTFLDDAPSAFSPVGLTDTTGATSTTQDDAVPNNGTAVVTRLLNDPDNDGVGSNFIGADGFGNLAFINGTDGDIFQNTSNEDITSGGNTIYLFGFGTDTLTATTSADNSDPSAVVFTVTLDEGTGAGDDATYTINFDQPLDDGSGTVLSDFGAIRPNNYDWVGFTSDGDLFDGIDNDGEDILITAFDAATGTIGTVNMSASDIGSNNQWVDQGETVRIDFVIDGTGAGNEKTPQAYGFDQHNDVTNASFSIIEVKSGGSNAIVTIKLFNDDDTGPIQTLDGASVDVLAGSVVVTDAGGNDITGTGATVVYNGDGTVTISGLAPGDNVSFDGDGLFNAFTITGENGDDFSLGAFGFRSEISGGELPFSFDLQATDDDGDSVASSIDITVVPDTSTSSSTSTSSASTASFSTSQMLLSDPMTGSGSNDNGPGGQGGAPNGGGLNGLGSIDTVYRSGMRSSEITLVAAISGAIILDQTVMEGVNSNALQPGVVKYDLVALDGAIANTAPPQGMASDLDAAGLLHADLDLNNASGPPDWTALSGESAIASSSEAIIGLQDRPQELELFDGDTGLDTPEMPAFFDGPTVGVDQAMEALLAFEPGLDAIADAASLDPMADAIGAEAGAVLAEITFDAALDQMIEGLAGPTDAADYLTAATGTLNAGMLDHLIENAVHSIGPVAPLDMQIDDAAASALQA